ncbi:MAG: amidohydrolase [Candidatus Heimdallarchaeaceae archaeon]
MVTKKLYADLVIKNANIWTMEKDQPRAEAVASFEDFIIKIGKNEDIEPLIGSNTIVIDAKRKTVIPGFCDAHTHLAWTGLNKLYLDLGSAKSIEEVLELVKAQTRKVPKGKWIIGRNWDQANWIEQRYITKDDLDPITPDHPVFLRHVSGHMATVNSLGFEYLKLPLDLKGVEKDTNGNVTGILRDVELDDYAELRPSLDDFVKGLELGMEEALKHGITSIHDNVTFEVLHAYRELIKANKMKIRVYAIVYQDMLDEIIKLGIKQGYGDKWFTFGAVKLMTDGALSSRTALLFEDYTDKPGERGFALYDKEKLTQTIKKVHEANLQVAAHAIGDKAIAQLVEAFFEAIPTSELTTRKHRIEHAELVREEEIKKATQARLVFSMQPNFVYRWGMLGINGMYEQRLGRERTMRNNPFRWVIEHDLVLAFGSDGMPIGPLYGIKGALFHPNPEQRLTLEEAIKCYTLYPAITSNQDYIKGSLKSGKLADMVILSHNLDELEDLNAFHEVKVETTIIGGKILYQRNNLPKTA